MNKTNVEFTDTSKECIQMMTKLSKNALKKGGKIVTNVLKSKMRVRTGGLKKSIVAWAKVDRKTGQPYLEVGYRSRAQMRKRGVKFFVNPTWFEFGIKPHTIMTNQLKNGTKTTYQLTDGNKSYGYIVQHPGCGNKNILRNTVYENIEEINKAIQEGLQELKDYTLTEGMNIDIGGDEEID